MGTICSQVLSMRLLLILLVFLTIVSLATAKGKGKGGKGKGKPKPTKPSEGTTPAPGGGKGKGKGKPKPPTATKPPIITIVEEEDGPWCFWCLRNNGGSECIPICGEDPTSWECRECVADFAPICLRACGFDWLQDRMLEMVNPSPPEPCILPFTGLPLKIGYNSTVSSEWKDILTADLCGKQCESKDPEHQGWTWANRLERDPNLKFTCWCLSIIGVPVPYIARDSSVTPNCPPSV